MKCCPKCGRENRDDATICRECGASLNPSKDGVICPVCGTENLSDAKFCDKCGSRFAVAATPKAVSEATIDDGVSRKEIYKFMGRGIAVCLAIFVAIMLVFSSGILVDDDQDDGGKIDLVQAKALDGTYHLSGGVKLNDGTEYWMVADISFNDGNLISKNSNTIVKEPDEDWDSGVNINRPTIHINSGEEIVVPDPPTAPGYTSVKDSMVAHNQFLEGMEDCADKYIKLSTGEVTGYGFEDSSGNIYYLLKDGRLAGYSQSYNGVKVLTVLDYHS